MLAAHLRRLEKPVRYAAMDPAHVRAIENYLRINTRAHGLPQLHQQAQGGLGALYQGHPEIAPHFQGIMQGDQLALSQYLDLLNEHGNMKPQVRRFGDKSPRTPLRDLLEQLGMLHDFGTEGRDYVQGWPRNIHTMYSQAALEHPSTTNLMLDRRHPLLAPLSELIGHLRSTKQGLPAEMLTRSARDLRETGLPQHLLNIHDTASAIPGYNPNYVAGNVQTILRRDLIPHLAENFG